MTLLRRVLLEFETEVGVRTLPAMAARLGIDLPTLRSIIAYWVERGELRAVHLSSDGGDCTACHHAHGCPYIVALPTAYERVRREERAQP